MKNKIGLLMFCLLFGLPFSAFGVLAIKSMADTLSSWWTARDWMAVSAHVLRPEPAAVNGEATLRYIYHFRGRRYESSRLGLTADNDIGNWQQAQRQRLAGALSEGKTVTVWVNPARPDHSVFNRDLHFGQLLFLLPFATLFPLVGLGACWGAWHTVRMTPSKEHGPPANQKRIRSSEGQGEGALALFALFWNLLTMPIAAFVLLERPGLGAHWLVLIFPLIGLALIKTILRSRLERRRLGTTTLTLSPTQPTLGSLLIAHIEFEKPPGNDVFALELISEHVDRRGSGKHTTTRTRLLWEQELRIRASNKTLRCQFELPAEGQASEAEGRHFIRWFLRLNWPDGRHSRDFPLTITQAGPDTPSAAEPGTPASALPAVTAPEPVDLPSSLVTLTPLANGLRLDYAVSRHRSLAGTLALVGAVFFGTAVLLGSRAVSGPSIVLLVFAALGVALLVVGFQHWNCPLRIEASSHGLTVRGRTLLRQVDGRWPAGVVRRIRPTVSYSSRSYPQQRYFYALQAELDSGAKVSLGDGIASRAVADLLARRIEEALRRPY